MVSFLTGSWCPVSSLLRMLCFQSYQGIHSLKVSLCITLLPDTGWHLSLLHLHHFRSISMWMTHMTLCLPHSYLKTLKVDNLLRKSCWIFPRLLWLTSWLQPFHPGHVFLFPAFYYTIKATHFLSDTHVRKLKNHGKLYILSVAPYHPKNASEFCGPKGPSSNHVYSFNTHPSHLAADTLALSNFSKLPTFTILMFSLSSFSCCKMLPVSVL